MLKLTLEVSLTDAQFWRLLQVVMAVAGLLLT